MIIAFGLWIAVSLFMLVNKQAATAAIDNGDYNIWRAHFGQSAGSGGAASHNVAVPEAASAWMLKIGAAIETWKNRSAAAAVSSTHNA